jgi:PAS domain S-box-containing protein
MPGKETEMKLWLKKLFILSENAEPEQKRTAQLLYTILLSSLLILVLYSGISFAVTRALFRLGVQLTVGLVLIFALVLLRGGKIRLASIILVSVLWCVFILAALLENGVDSPSFGGLVLLILFAGALLGFRFGLAITVLSILAGVTIASLQVNGLLPAPLYSFSPFDRLGINAAYFASSLTLLYLATHHLNKVLRQVQIELEERRQTEAALRKSEQRYRALFERTNDGIFILSLDGVIVEVNQQAAKMLGYAPDELIGRNADDFVIPDQKVSGGSQISTLITNGEIPIYERKALRGDDTSITVEINAGVVYDVNGNPQNIQSIVRDITERKRAEEALRDLIRQLEHQRAKIQTSLDVSKAAISILDPQSLIQQTVDLIKARFEYDYVGLFLVDENRQFAILRGGTGEAGKKMLANRHKLPIGDGSMIGWSIANKQPRIALDVGLDAVHFDNPLLPDTRSEMTLPLIARGGVIGALTVQSEIEAAFFDEDIAVLQVTTDLVAVAIDNAGLHAQITTYTEELEQRVRERTAQLQMTNRELESFSYSVSHDLRAPLRAISGYASILLEDFANELSPQARGFLEKIRGNAIRMGALIDGLLTLSHLGRKKVQKSEVDPNSLVREVLEEVESEIESRQVEILIGELPLCEADPLLLKQVYANLISNAIKFTREREDARIEIDSQYTERGLTYFVKDNGAGFDMQYADRLFRVFQRLHREDEFEGTGIGLVIIQRIILRHGGEIWAQGELEKGATFFFTLGGITIDDSGIFF